MNTLSMNEQKEMKGGFLSLSGVLGLSSLAVFLVGVFDGYTRPLKCRR